MDPLHCSISYVGIGIHRQRYDGIREEIYDIKLEYATRCNCIPFQFGIPGALQV